MSYRVHAASLIFFIFYFCTFLPVEISSLSLSVEEELIKSVKVYLVGGYPQESYASIQYLQNNVYNALIYLYLPNDASR
jgi:hypothetical protein